MGHRGSGLKRRADLVRLPRAGRRAAGAPRSTNDAARWGVAWASTRRAGPGRSGRRRAVDLLAGLGVGGAGPDRRSGTGAGSPASGRPWAFLGRRLAAAGGHLRLATIVLGPPGLDHSLESWPMALPVADRGSWAGRPGPDAVAPGRAAWGVARLALPPITQRSAWGLAGPAGRRLGLPWGLRSGPDGDASASVRIGDGMGRRRRETAGLRLAARSPGACSDRRHVGDPRPRDRGRPALILAGLAGMAAAAAACWDRVWEGQLRPVSRRLVLHVDRRGGLTAGAWAASGSCWSWAGAGIPSSLAVSYYRPTVIVRWCAWSSTRWRGYDLPGG